MTNSQPTTDEKKLAEKGCFINLVAIALADGQITHEEYDMLYTIGRRFGINTNEVDEIINFHNQLEFIIPETKEDRNKQLIAVIRMMWVDGAMDASEVALVKGFCSRMGYKNEQAERLMEKVSTMVLDEASDADILDEIR